MKTDLTIYLVAALATLTQCHINHVKVNIVTKKCLHRSREEFLSTAIGCAMIKHDWRYFKMEDEAVIAMARGIAPGFLRFGGTACDCVTFDKAAANPLQREQTNLTLRASDWDRLVKFAHVTNLTLIYGANVLLRNKQNQWDPSNFIDFLNYNMKRGNKNLMFELGNEPNSFPRLFNKTLNGSQLASDFAAMRKILQSHPMYKKSLLVGADISHPYRSHRSYPAELMHDFFKAGHPYIDAFTWHDYYLAATTASVDDFINSTVMEHFPQQVAAVNSIIHAVLGPDQTFPLWMGETGSAFGGGAPNISNTYVAGFLWMDKLGVAARSGYNVVMRHSFFGGWFALVTRQLTPSPDYWLALMYKRLVGTKALSLNLSANNSVRAYASCTNPRYGVEAGSVTVYAMNLDRLTSAMISVDMKYNSLRSFNMEPTDGTLTSLHVNINGERMRLVNKTLPEIHANITDYIVLKPLTFGFFVLVGANATACM